MLCRAVPIPNRFNSQQHIGGWARGAYPVTRSDPPLLSRCARSPWPRCANIAPSAAGPLACVPRSSSLAHPVGSLQPSELFASPSELLASPNELLASTQRALSVTQRALSVTQRALSITQRALSVTQRALNITQRALSVTQQAQRQAGAAHLELLLAPKVLRLFARELGLQHGVAAGAAHHVRREPSGR
jgi:hypothetical protein